MRESDRKRKTTSRWEALSALRMEDQLSSLSKDLASFRSSVSKLSVTQTVSAICINICMAESLLKHNGAIAETVRPAIPGGTFNDLEHVPPELTR
jgi:hypothetical protein